MKLPQDNTQNNPGIALLVPALAQSGLTVSVQSNRGFAENLRQQINAVAANSRTTAKPANHESARQASTDKQATNKRGTELPVREQKLPSDNTRTANTAAEQGTLETSRSNRQSTNASPKGAGLQSETVDADSGHRASGLPGLADSSHQATDSFAISAYEDWSVSAQSTEVSDTGFELPDPAFLTQTEPAEFSNAANSDGLLASDTNQTPDLKGVLNPDLQTEPVTVPLSGSVLTGSVLPGTTDDGAVPVTEENVPLSPQSVVADYPADNSEVWQNAAHVAFTDFVSGVKPALSPAMANTADTGDLLLQTPAAAVLPAAASGLVPSGNRQQTGMAPAALPTVTPQLQSSTADIPVTSETSLATDSGIGNSPDEGLTFSEKLLNLRPSLSGYGSGSAQYASMLAQSGTVTTALSAAPVAQGLMSLMVSGQTGTETLSSSLTAASSGSAGTSSSGNQTSGLAASLYSLDQRQQAAAEARLVHAQANRGMDTSLASASALKLPGLDATFGQNGWIDRVGRQLLLQSAQGSSSAQIRLDPPELGSLTVRIQLVDQAAAVNFVSPHAMVRDALEQQSARLQEMFREQGMDLVDVSVSDQSAHSEAGGDRESGRARNASAGNQTEEIHAPEAQLKKSDSLIDFYA